MKPVCIFAFLLLSGFLSCRKEIQSVAAPTPPPIVATSKTYPPEEINAFKQLTVNGEFNDGLIHKLQQTTLVYLADSSYPLINRELDTVLSEINRLTDTNLVMLRTNSLLQSAIRVYPTSRSYFLQVEPNAASAFSTSGYELVGLMYPYLNEVNQMIAHESVFVDMEKTGTDSMYQRFLLHHEMMHALGFYGHIHIDSYAYGSVMYYYSLQPYLVRYKYDDARMIGLLYNPALTSGMDETAFDSVVVNL